MEIDTMEQESSYETSFNPEIESPCEAIMRALATISGNDQLDMQPPLFESVDPDALNRIITSSQSGTTRVSFTHSDYQVMIESNGNLHLTETKSENEQRE